MEGDSDSDDDAKPRNKQTAKKLGARTKDCPGCGAKVGISVKECAYCDHLFTSKSQLNNQTQALAAEESLGIRERFHFEPEREDDGSLLISAILGRRPAAGAKKFSRMYTVSREGSATEEKYDHEYLIKYKDMSYRHCQWLTASEIDAMSMKSKSSLSRYLTKIDKGDPSAQEDGEIDPTWLEVEKVLDMREEEVSEVVDFDADEPAADMKAAENAESDKKESSTALTSRTSFASQSSLVEEESEKSSDSDNDGDDVKVKSVTQIFQHEQRCRKVLERIWDDPYAASFVEPVNTDLFDDYLDIVEEPMCLSDVKTRLEDGEYSRYNMHNKFMQDIRLIWKNCKMYNLHKSQIWHSAHTLSMMSERLFQAWVLSYSDGSIDIKDPLGQPWEQTCRSCQLDEDEPNVILCDHCDASFHIYCLKPPLKEIPEGSWMCPRCIRWLERSRSKLLTATAEDQARHIAENAGVRKVIRVRKRKYLVKWRGLSYRECTWDLPADVGDDSLIAEYHKLNDSPPDEPPLTQAELDAELRKDRAKPLEQVKVSGYFYNPAYDVDAEVYAQIRALHFLKWDQIPPAALLKDCGPECFAYARGHRTDMILPSSVTKKIDTIRSGPAFKAKDSGVTVLSQVQESDVPSYCTFQPKIDAVQNEISDMLGSMVNAICRNSNNHNNFNSHSRLCRSDKCPSEIEVMLPRFPDGKLYLRVANYYGRVAIVGFFKVPGKTGLHPLVSRVKQGDILTAINGVSLTDFSFQAALSLLTSITSPYIYLRFLRTLDRSGPEGAKDRAALVIRQNDARERSEAEAAAAMGASGQRIVDKANDLDEADDPELDVVQRYLNRKRSRKQSFRLPTKRSLYQGVFSTSDGKWEAIYFQHIIARSVGIFDDELEAAQARDAALRAMLGDKKKRDLVSPTKLTFEKDGQTLLPASKALFRIVTEERKLAAYQLANIQRRDILSDESKISNDQTSAAEGDAMDVEPVSASPNKEGQNSTPQRSKSIKAETGTPQERGTEDAMEINSLDSRDSDSEIDTDSDDPSDADSESSDGSWDVDENGEWRPVKEIFAAEIDGPTSRLLRAVNEADMPPIRSDWENYILEDCMTNKKPVTSAAVEASTEKKLNALINVAGNGNITNAKQVDQLDMTTGEIVNTWPSVTIAARNANISTTLIHECLSGKKDSGGGFRWRESKKAEQEAVQELLDMLKVEEEEEAAAAAAAAEALKEDEDGEDEEKADTELDFSEKKRVTKENSWTLKLYRKSKEYKNSGNFLRDYQREGLNWMLRCYYQKKSVILADEMGLGKTVQVVTFLEHLFEVEALKGPFLICVPLSTIGHWRREFDGWSKMIVNTYHDTGGGRDMRDIIREFEWYYKGRSRRLLKFHALLCTYDDMIRDYEELAEIPWRAVVVDEAHRLRNVNSKLLECMRAVLQRGLNAYGYQHRTLLTGTPLQNNTQELWSLLNFIEPAKFPDADKFSTRFGNIQTQEQVLGLQRRIAPHLLRRVKEDVAKDIPPKEETIIDVELTTIQKQYYRAIYEHNHGFLMQQMKGNMPKLMNIQMELRKCCNHPYLVNGVEDLEEQNLETKLREAAKEKGIKPPEFERSNAHGARKKNFTRDPEYIKRRMEDNIIPTSGKMVLLDKLLPKLKAEGHKVLIFSQMVRMLDLIGEFCEYRKYKHERLDGRVSGNDRQKGIDRFNHDADAFLFLLSTRAGGVGINLTAADTVIIFDSDWNPQNDVQAMARCHRIGQHKSVTIYRLITRRSFEAEMFDRASRKLGLEQAVLGTRTFADHEGGEEKDDKKVDAKEMEQLLKEGAYAVLLDDEEAQADMKEFYEQDIDKILASRSHVLISESGQKTESWLNKKKSRARKTTFVGANAEHADLDVNDPDFWKKVLPDLVTPDSMLDQLDGMEDNEDFNMKKFVKDMSNMINGMLDLHHRGQLPDRERLLCQDLLFRFTLNESFSERDRGQAQAWLALIEGTRQRKARVDLNKPDRGSTRLRQSGGADSDLEGNSGSDDDSAVEEVEEYDSDGRKTRKKSGKPRKYQGPGSRGGKGGYGPRKKLIKQMTVDEDGNIVEVMVEVPKQKPGRKPRGPNDPPSQPRKKKERDPNRPLRGPGSRGGPGIRKKRREAEEAERRAKRMKLMQEHGEADQISGQSGTESNGEGSKRSASIDKSNHDSSKMDESSDSEDDNKSEADPYSNDNGIEYL